MKKMLLAALIVLPLVIVRAAPDLGDFAARRQAVLEGVWAEWQATSNKPAGRDRFIRAAVLFEGGHVDAGRRLAHLGLDQFVPGNKENRWMYGGNSGFNVWPGIDCYIRYERFMDEPLKARFKQIYTGAVFYPQLSTSNHKIMAAVTRYLATQTWGADAFHPDPAFKGEHDRGSYFGKNDPTGEKYVRYIIAETLKQGPGEYASRPYGTENVLPLLTLAECAKDETIRRPALEAYEHCLMQLAPVWLRGHLATFAPRSYPDMETQQPHGVAALAWFYFGGLPPRELIVGNMPRAALSDYRPPAALVEMATNRAAAYVHRALIDKWALYHFVNRDYVLFSRSPKARGLGFQGQSYPCGVMWEDHDPAHVSHLWITNPAADDNTSKDNCPNGLHTHGVSKFEQEVQCRDALLFVFDIPADFRNPYALGYIPAGTRAVIDDSRTAGRIFLHYGSVVIAITAAEPFAWDRSAGIRAPAGKANPGDSEFRIMKRQTALALECTHPSEFAGADPAAQLAAFRQRIMEKTTLQLRTDGKVTGTYTDRDGHVLVCEYGGTDTIDGAPIDYAHWPALENPWMTKPSVP